jgi:hypothetical protein
MGGGFGHFVEKLVHLKLLGFLASGCFALLLLDLGCVWHGSGAKLQVGLDKSLPNTSTLELATPWSFWSCSSSFFRAGEQAARPRAEGRVAHRLPQ